MGKAIVFFLVVLGFAQAASASAEEERTYVVGPGDRFEEVAERFGVTPGEIRAANPRAYGIICGSPYARERRDGTLRAFCGRPRYYLIAGATLSIPTPRIVIESENVRLNDEAVGFRDERDNLRKELDALHAQRDRLVEEQNALQSANGQIASEKAELESRYNQLKMDFGATLARQPKQVEVWKTEWRDIAIAVLITVGLAIVGLSFILRRKGRNEREFDHLVKLVQPSVIRQAKENEERRRHLDEEAQALAGRRIDLDEGHAQLQEKRGQFLRWEVDLAGREKTLEIGQEDLREGQERLAEEEQSLADRNTACVVRENAVEARLAEVIERERAFALHVQAQDRELGEKDQGVQELRKTLTGQKAQQDLRDIDQDKREEMLKQGFDELNAARERLRQERDKFARESEQVEAGLRCLKEDGPIFKQRAREIKAREDAVATRESKAGDQEAILARLLAEVDERERILTGREDQLIKERDALQTEQDELARRREEFEQRLADAQHIIEAAGGLEAAQNTLKRARRKEEVVAILDTREATMNEREARLTALKDEIATRDAAIAARERECETREGALKVWEERRARIG